MNFHQFVIAKSSLDTMMLFSTAFILILDQSKSFFCLLVKELIEDSLIKLNNVSYSIIDHSLLKIHIHCLHL